MTDDRAKVVFSKKEKQAGKAGDATQWVYHAGTMALQQKLDANGKGAAYTYDARGPLLTREWARLKAGSTTVKVTSTYTHNALGELSGISYNDGTPAVSLLRDGAGKIATINDGTGARTFTYNDAGLLAEESSAGVPPAGSGAGVSPALPYTLTRSSDAAGRADGIALWAAPNGGTGGYATWQGWDYDAATGTVAGLSMPDGRMERSAMPGGMDVMLRLTTEQTNGATSHRISDGFGRVTATTASVSAGRCRRT